MFEKKSPPFFAAPAAFAAIGATAPATAPAAFAATPAAAPAADDAPLAIFLPGPKITATATAARAAIHSAYIANVRALARN